MATQTIDTIQFPGSENEYSFNAQNLVAGGTSGQVLTSNGSSIAPSWKSPSITNIDDVIIVTSTTSMSFTRKTGGSSSSTTYYDATTFSFSLTFNKNITQAIELYAFIGNNILSTPVSVSSGTSSATLTGSINITISSSTLNLTSYGFAWKLASSDAYHKIELGCINRTTNSSKPTSISSTDKAIMLGLGYTANSATSSSGDTVINYTS